MARTPMPGCDTNQHESEVEGTVIKNGIRIRKRLQSLARTRMISKQSLIMRPQYRRKWLKAIEVNDKNLISESSSEI